MIYNIFCGFTGNNAEANRNGKRRGRFANNENHVDGEKANPFFHIYAIGGIDGMPDLPDLLREQ